MQAPATPARLGRPDSRAGGLGSAQQPAAGPSTSTPPTKAGPATTAGGPDNDLWTEILRGADRQKALSRKNVVLLSERHRGRRSLLDKLVGKRRTREAPAALAIGYDVLEQGDRDEGTCAGCRCSGEAPASFLESQLADFACRRRTASVRVLSPIITPRSAPARGRVTAASSVACECSAKVGGGDGCSVLVSE